MSILIKGMKMPKDCIDCPFCDYEQGLCLAANDMDTAPRTIGVRHSNCPLVEVPTPHGRLIDGDNVIDLLREQLTGDRDTVYEYYDDGLEMAISELSIVTTIIEAEEGEA